ncbi:TraR/DksA family transcriptional regulator [Rheinheimera sp.]|uniref:TraR/DksA family transcriptional regulator n=1 Tax=Rheinheimera sp. TaxID=1869214 RepID=UPI00307F4950
MDVLDRAQDLEALQRDNALKQALNRPTEPQDIDQNGNHFCNDCGVHIPAERMAIVPSAVCCIDCQEIREHKRKQLCSKS